MARLCLILLFINGLRIHAALQTQSAKQNEPTFAFDVINSDRMVVSWQREGIWTDETRYFLTIRESANPEVDWCHSTSYICFTHSCVMDTKDFCPQMEPCTSYSLMLLGGVVQSEWHYKQTAPADYGGLNVEVVLQTLHVSWAWPEIPPQHQACLIDFLATVTSVGRNETVHVPRKIFSEENPVNNVSMTFNYDLGTCDTGGGVVRIQATGGDGYSEGEVRGFTFDAEGLPPVLVMDPLDVGTDNITVTWHLHEKCPLIDTFKLYAIDEANEIMNGPIFSTLYSHTYNNLFPNTTYNVCVQPLGAFGEAIPAGDNVCQTVTTLP
ncbi:hypothetical protein SK128_017440 [Halocaridina rubra]|uniref:Fibronectin type-III domain-containing protein n=1 Tax=Halocaridina rubra TaxID=373956 RepID=A0AAN9AGR2_HALRR